MFQSFSLNWHTLQRHQNVQRDFNSQNVVMVLQPHNSKLTIELLQDLKIISKTITQANTTLKIELIQSLSELDKIK